MAPEARVSRYQGDLQNPDNATAETVALMCGYIGNALRDPMVKAAALDALRRFRGGPVYASAGIDPQKSPGAQCESVWWWAKHILKFVHHDGLIQLWFNERDQLQLLIAPDLLLRMGEPRGDCAIYTMLECAMLQALGIQFEIVTAAVDPNVPDEFSHVYPRAVLPGGRRLVLDASHGKYPGWEVPRQHTIRKQVWSSDGQPIEDAAPARSGLHAYNPRPTRPRLPSRLALVPGVPFNAERQRRGLGRYFRGMGDDGTSVDTIQDPNTGALYSTATGQLISNPSGNPVAPAIFSSNPAPTIPTPATTPTSPGTNWGGVLGNLLNQWTGIAGKVIAPTTTIQSGPGGTFIQAPSGAALPNTALLPGAVTGNSTMLLLLGGGLLLVMLLANKK